MVPEVKPLLQRGLPKGTQDLPSGLMWRGRPFVQVTVELVRAMMSVCLVLLYAGGSLQLNVHFFPGLLASSDPFIDYGASECSPDHCCW